MFTADKACVHEAGGVFLSEEELGAGDSDLDLLRLELRLGRCWPTFRILADAQPRILLLPDLLSLLLDIDSYYPLCFWNHRRNIRTGGYNGAVMFNNGRLWWLRLYKTPQPAHNYVAYHYTSY